MSILDDLAKIGRGVATTTSSTWVNTSDKREIPRMQLVLVPIHTMVVTSGADRTRMVSELIDNDIYKAHEILIVLDGDSGVIAHAYTSRRAEDLFEAASYRDTFGKIMDSQRVVVPAYPDAFYVGVRCERGTIDSISIVLMAYETKAPSP